MLKHHIDGLDHVALKLTDLTAGRRFFVDLLGFKIAFELDFDDTHILFLQAGKIQLELWENTASAAPPAPTEAFTRPGVNHLAFAVKNLDHVISTVQAAGYTLLTPPYEPTAGIREAVFLGPDNLEIQFVQQNVPLLIWRSLKGDFRPPATP